MNGGAIGPEAHARDRPAPGARKTTTVSDEPTNSPRSDRRGGADRRQSARSNVPTEKRSASSADRRARVRRRSDHSKPEQDEPGNIRPFPTTQADVSAWVRSELSLPPEQEQVLIEGIAALLFRYERLWERSKSDAISALITTFTGQIDRLKGEISHRDATVNNVAQYFERIVGELTVRASHDPKTQLMNFARFLEELETYLTIEQRGRWCAVGLVDINSFKWYNDTFGHVVGDQIIERVARLLQEHVRAADLVAHDSGRELHARFGGDEFCFLIPNLDDVSVAASIADRFRDAVGRHDWSTEDPRLAKRPVTVDVGVACLLLGPLAERRRMGPQLARELLACADRLMYQAKGDHAAHAYPLALRVENLALVPVDPLQAS